MSTIPGLVSRRGAALHAAGWLALALTFGALGALASVDAERTARVIVLLAAAGLGVGAPHRMFPDPHRAFVQLANLRPAELLRRRLGLWLPIPLVVSAAPVGLALAAGQPWLAAETALGVLAVGLYAFARYVPLGERTGRWERGEAGGLYRSIGRRLPPYQFQVPDALVPGLLVTAEVFLVGALVATVGRALGAIPIVVAGAGQVWTGASPLSVLPAVVLLGLAAVLTVRRAARFDVHAYGSDAVWADAFRATPGADAGRPSVAYGAVYWAPHRLRPHVWAGLVSLDRRFPLGRIVALALLVVVVAVWTGAPDGVRWAALGLTLLAATAPLALTASDEILPGALTARLSGVVAWSAARWLMAVRWVPPVAVTVGLAAWLSDAVTGQEAVFWIGAQLVLAALVALAVTLVQRARTRRAYA